MDRVEAYEQELAKYLWEATELSGRRNGLAENVRQEKEGLARCGR